MHLKIPKRSYKNEQFFSQKRIIIKDGCSIYFLSIDLLMVSIFRDQTDIYAMINGEETKI